PVDAVRATCSYIAEHPGDADILMQQIKVAVANVDAWDQFAAGVVFEQQRNEYLQKQLNRSTVEGQEIPDFIFSINQNLQAMFAEGLPGEAHTDCGISSAVVALFLENRFGADVAIERYRGGCKYARAGTTNHHIWLVVTDTRTGVKYYVSVSDGQFADPPAGISVPRLYLFAGRKEPVLIDKTGYRQWYYSEEGPTHATVARLSARPLAEALEAGPGMIDGKKIENEVVAELDVIRLRAVLGLMPKYFPSLVLPVLLDTVRNNEVASNV
ncbi:MAG: hypothetical protein WCG78_05940, partial [Candidatus Omnitrophota bacterium]